MTSRTTDPSYMFLQWYELRLHCKKKVGGFPVAIRDVTYQTLPGRELFNYSRPGRV